MIQPLIWIEGIIGAGKTTAAKEIGKKLQLHVYCEPINEKLLKMYYNDQKRWGFSFQIDMLHKRFAIQMEAAYRAVNNYGAIIDRGLPADRIFAKMLMNNNKIHPAEWEIYEHAYDILIKSLTPPNLLIFLNVSPEIAYERIKERDREAERGDLLPLNYLIQLHQVYQELWNELHSGEHPWSQGLEIWKVDWNENWQSLDPLIEQIKVHYNILNISFQEHAHSIQRTQKNTIQ